MEVIGGYNRRVKASCSDSVYHRSKIYRTKNLKNECLEKLSPAQNETVTSQLYFNNKRIVNKFSLPVYLNNARQDLNQVPAPPTALQCFRAT